MTSLSIWQEFDLFRKVYLKRKRQTIEEADNLVMQVVVFEGAEGSVLERTIEQ